LACCQFHRRRARALRSMGHCNPIVVLDHSGIRP
jgi:hypothetical protein